MKDKQVVGGEAQGRQMREPIGLDVSWLTSHLAMGGRWPPEAAGWLASRLNIRHVVDVRGEERDDAELMRRHGMTLLHLPTVDRCALTQEMLERGVHWVNGHLDAGRRVLVHCEHGIGRSAVVALCVLVARGLAPLKALEHARRVRAKVSPSPEQLECFISFLRALRERQPVEWELPTVDELGRLAWQPLLPQPT